ncbi:MAG TPA: hypothetical protein VF927_08425 [Solirubrobacteraceae bacterium]
MTEHPSPDLDAALVLGMASTAIPFALSREEEAARWLRILRLQGEAGAALQALGVSEAPLEAPLEQDESERPPGSGDIVVRVGDAAALAAARRGAKWFGTTDVLVAVIDVYGSDFNNVLRAHGTDRDEVLERLDLLAA